MLVYRYFNGQIRLFQILSVHMNPNCVKSIDSQMDISLRYVVITLQRMTVRVLKFKNVQRFINILI